MKNVWVVGLILISLQSYAKSECAGLEDESGNLVKMKDEDKKPKAEIKTPQGHILLFCYLGPEKNPTSNYKVIAYIKGKKRVEIAQGTDSAFRVQVSKDKFSILETSKDGNADLTQWDVKCDKETCELSEKMCPDEAKEMKSDGKYEEAFKAADDATKAKLEAAGCGKTN